MAPAEPSAFRTSAEGRQPLGQMLHQAGKITLEEIDAALREQSASGRMLGEILLQRALVTEADLYSMLAQQAEMEFLDLSTYDPDRNVFGTLPVEMMRRLTVLPLGMVGDTLMVAVGNGFDVMAIDEVRRKHRDPVHLVWSPPSQIQALVSEMAPFDRGTTHKGLGRHFSDQRLNKPVVKVSVEDHEKKLKKVTQLITEILDEAIRRRASDVHIEPEEDRVQIRIRVDGFLQQAQSLPVDLLRPMVNRIKVLARLNIAEYRIPQEGRISYTTSGEEVDLRISTFPTVTGEKIAIRLLRKNTLIRSLESLGMSPDVLANYRHMLERPRGILLVVGPTGAGKTTTLYSSLTLMNATGRNIVTIEDPVEYKLPGIRQSQINVPGGFDFTIGMRSMLRMDPDVMFVGEIRDLETTRLAVRAALGGVLLFSTLHASDALGALPRLMDMGLEPYLVSSTIVGVLAQRLVRVVCPHCRKPAEYQPEMLQQFGIMNGHASELRKGTGCLHCSGTGYFGRTGIFELMVMNDELARIVKEKPDASALRDAALNSGMHTMREEGLKKVFAGVTTLEEVARVTTDASGTMAYMQGVVRR